MSVRAHAAWIAAACLVALPSPASAGYIGVQIKVDDDGKGIAVVSVIADSPADKAGLKADDVITHADDTAVGDLKSFVEKVKDTKAGETLKLAVLRDGKKVEIKVTVGDPPA